MLAGIYLQTPGGLPCVRRRERFLKKKKFERQLWGEGGGIYTLGWYGSE
jgi:hypothetical protein